MYFKISCSNCQKPLKVRDEDVGKKGRCPYCNEGFTVPARIADAPVARPKASAGEAASAAVPTTPSAPKHRPPQDTPAPRPRARKPKQDTEWTDATNVSLLISGAIGLVAAGVFLLLLWPFKDTGFGALFLKRGWVPFVLAFFMGWALAMVVLKYRKLKTQRRSMLFDLLPTEIDDEINLRNLDRFTRHIEDLPVKPGASFLVTRVLRGLEHFRVRKSTPEVGELLTSQGDIDANAVESSYSILKVFIWAIPILGFIGTVLGISDAVSGLGGELDASDMEKIKKQLGTVTTGLGVAFDTTLVALVMSLLVMFPASAMQKAEEDLLNQVDEYCNDNLLIRLNDVGSATASHTSVDLNDTINKAIDAALTGRQGAMLHQIDQIQKQMLQMQREHSEKLDASMRDLSMRTEHVHQDVAGSIMETTEQIKSSFGDIHRSLHALNDVLSKLGGERIEIELKAPPKRGWRLFNRKDNGG